MNSCKTLLTLTLCCAVLPARADSLFGLYLGADSWQTSNSGSFASQPQQQSFSLKSQNQLNYSVALEHFLPLVPHLRLQRGYLQTRGDVINEQPFDFAGERFTAGTSLQSAIKLTHTDYILYYKPFDNMLFHLNMGLSAKKLSGHVQVSGEQKLALQRVEQWLPMLYADSRLALFGTGIDLFASAQFTSLQRTNLYDVQAGFGYSLVDNLLIDARFKLGYRAVDLKLDNLDSLYAELNFQGIFAGVEIHF